MITFTELEVVLMIGWVVTVFAFIRVNKELTKYCQFVEISNHLIEGIADKKVTLSRDKDNEIDITVIGELK